MTSNRRRPEMKDDLKICVFAFNALHSMYCMLCIMFYALYSMHCILCIILYALYHMYCIIWIALYTLHSMHSILCIPFFCVILFALYSLNCTICIVFYTLSLNSKHFTICVAFMHCFLCIAFYLLYYMIAVPKPQYVYKFKYLLFSRWMGWGDKQIGPSGAVQTVSPKQPQATIFEIFLFFSSCGVVGLLFFAWAPNSQKYEDSNGEKISGTPPTPIKKPILGEGKNKQKWAVSPRRV